MVLRMFFFKFRPLQSMKAAMATISLWGQCSGHMLGIMHNPLLLSINHFVS